jgi:hypothetical protein
MKRVFSLSVSALLIIAGCSKTPPAPTKTPANAVQPAPVYFHVDTANVGSVEGTVRYTGPRPAAKLIDMSEDPACVAAHKGKAHDESLVVGAHGGLGNAFVYIEKGLEGKQFEVPKEPVIIDQSGCWFRPRILGIQVNQILRIVNSDPVTHNIHPMAMANREWNHSQGPGDPPVDRHFIKQEVMIPVKCNIHSWMHAYIGVVDNPYFAVTKDDGSFSIPNLPPGTYTLTVWHEKLGVQRQEITVAKDSKAPTHFTFPAK